MTPAPPPHDSAATDAILDNPIWFALLAAREAHARRGALAARYEPEVSPLAAVAEVSPAALDDLAALATPGELVAIFRDPDALPPHPAWSVGPRFLATQMVWREPSRVAPLEGEPLSEDDVTAMIALVRATDPGPFARRTIELGDYLGIRDGGELMAMAGERFRPPGFSEISAVCTDERARGRGYAAGLVAALVERIHARGEVPFLHVREGSPSEATAKRAYERCGFRVRRSLPYTLLTRR